MHLKRLDIQGFKSFPEKVRLEFNHGITAVVGPNGSGKSNISDSVRWVLGEQKAKSLRGEKMEDVIFAGTESRKALGFAQVSITIDNQDGKMPIAYSEVTVSRRVFRSGESEYQINGTSCRLKDVHELFMDTGIGKEGYSIIGQGKIDEILSSKSDDRRRLFEEAAGIVKFKNRRQDAVANLEKERQNLLRVEDIITELEGQLEPLSEQSEIAKEFFRLKERLKKIEIAVFQSNMDKMEEELHTYEQKKEITTQQLEEENKQVAFLKEAIVELRGRTSLNKEQLQQTNHEVAQNSSQVEKKQGEIQLSQEQAQNYTANIQRIELEIRNKQEKIQGLENQIQIAMARRNAMQVGIHSQKESLMRLEGEFESLSETLSKSEGNIDEYKSEMLELIRKSTEAKGNISRAESMLAQFAQRFGQLSNEKAYMESQISDNETRIQALKKQAEENEGLSSTIVSQIEASLEQREEIHISTAMMKSTLIAKEKQLGEKKSRMSVLSDMEREHEGFYKSVKSILKQKEQGDVRFKGVFGAVGQLLKVEKKYETALEVALGGAMQNIVTENEESAKSCILYLKKNNLGRATFLPVTAVKGKVLGRERDLIIKEPGVLGIAQDLVKFDPIFQGVVSNLLGRVIIIQELNSAVAFAKKYNHSYRVVTLEGDVLNPGGAMTGGSISQKATNIFGRSREIKELDTDIEVLEQESARIGKEIASNRQITAAMEEEENQKRLHLQELRTKIEIAGNEIQRVKSQLAELHEKYQLYALEEKQLTAQKQRIQTDLQKYEAVLEDATSQSKEIDNTLSLFQNSLESERQKREDLLSNITDLKVSISTQEQTEESNKQEIRRHEEEIRMLEKEIAQNTVSAEQAQLLAEEKKKEAEIGKAELVEIRAHMQQGKALLEQLESESRVLLEKMAQAEEKMQTLAQTVSLLQNDSFRMEAKLEKLGADKVALCEKMMEEYEVALSDLGQEAPLEGNASQWANEAKELRKRIRDLGAVNVNAVEAYKEVRQRYEFLGQQKNDILDAEEKLKIIIGDLSVLMEQQFKEQFALISKNFNETFREMFGGGKAYLKLSDEEDVLGSGIEIIAQPPGKNLQNMMLLSGGERALTAISILFSILKMKPSPFCILDEIEAALDDANVRRYASYLERFSAKTQFIVITHRKGTMESADVLYGITMQEKGVSKLVSVNFTKNGTDTKYA